MKYILTVLLISCLGFNANANENARSLFSKGNGVTFNSKMEVSVSIQEERRTDISTNKTSKNKEAENKVDIIKNENTPSYSGFSYQLLKKTGNDEFKRVNPSYSFKTGDRIVVEVMSNSDGYLVTGNIDSNDKPRLLSLNQINAGQTVRIPQRCSLKFIEPAGTEKLVFVLSNNQLDKQSSGKLVKKCRNNTRSMIFVEDDAGQSYQLLNKDGSCKAKNKNSVTRSIIVDVEDDVGYGVVEDDNLKAGELLSLIINLKHL